MATNNSVNNNFPTSGVTMTGTVNINGSGSSTTTIGSSVSGATNFAAGSASTYTLANKTFTLTTGTGTLNIGTDATVKNIVIGGGSTSAIAFTGAQCTLLSTGNNFFTKIGTGGYQIVNNGGSIIFDGNSSATLGINSVTSSTSINIGTVSGDIPITLGNSNSSSSLLITAGTGGINIGTTGAKTINIGNTTGATGIILCSSFQSPSYSIYYPSINITSSTSNLIPGLYHIINTVTVLTTLTLPTTCAVGSIITIAGNAVGGWIIAQNSGQSINSTAASTTTGITGTLASGGQYDCVQIECVVANTTWCIKSSIGTLVFV